MPNSGTTVRIRRPVSEPAVGGVTSDYATELVYHGDETATLAVNEASDA